MARSHHITLVRHFVIALALGICAALVVIGNDPWVKNYVGTAIKQAYARSFNCSMSACVERVNFIFPTLEFSQVTVAPQSSNAWSWRAQRMTMTFSWLQLMRSRAVDVHVQFDGLQARSQLTDTNLEIMEHVNRLIYSSSPVPINLKSLIFKQSDLTLEDPERASTVRLTWSSESKNIDHRFISTVRFGNGSFNMRGDCYASALQGVAQIHAQHKNGGVHIDAQADCSVELPHLPNEHRCSIKGIVQGTQGTVAIANGNQSCDIRCSFGPKNDQDFEIKGKANLPLAALSNFVSIPLLQHLQGTATVDGCATVCIKDQETLKQLPDFHGTIMLSPIINNQAPGTYTISCKTKDATLSGAISGSAPFLGPVSGKVTLHSDGSATARLATLDTMSAGFTQGWDVKPGGLSMRIDRDARGILRSSCTMCVDNKDKKKQCEISAGYSSDVRKQSCDASINGKPLLHLEAVGAHNPLQGTIEVASLKELVALISGYEVQGEGTIKTGLEFGPQTKINVELARGSTLRVPQTYNVIQGFRAQFIVDTKERIVAMHDCLCSFHKGFLRSEHAIARFDDRNQLAYAYLPVSIDSCLLSFKKDLFAMVTGHMIGTYDRGASHIRGDIVIEHCQLHENIFSPAFVQQLRSYAGSQVASMSHSHNTCDITVETMTPIIIKTPLLETAAKATVHITQSLLAPQIAGSLSLLSGTIYFPYKPLHISKGSLIFMPQKPFDPLVELIAKNMIKHYRVSLQLTGSLQEPNVIIESSPALTQEQIVALLLVGSPDDSLNVVMPTLLMQNLTTIVFSDKQTPTGLAVAFNKLLLPFKRIHVTPRFTDQTARGGLRGALDIEVSDRLHASIEKNFSLSEDTRFEADYLLSDDVSVRAIRNERRDVSGEVEMRWKF